jgi:2,3-bisphosphoglycerate-dependent phosphoglycerate mutase
MPLLVLLRHGESLWNRENRFTGWSDVGLSPAGCEEAERAALLMRAAGIGFDRAYTSVLARAIETLRIALRRLDLERIPVEQSWRLNERHYGDLEGMNKREAARRHGEEQVRAWRRGYRVRPPLVSKDDPRHPNHDTRYRSLDPALLPAGESLADVVARLEPLWRESVAPALTREERVLVAAHGSTVRALAKTLEGISDEDIVALDIPTGFPLVYTLDAALRPSDRRYLGDPGRIAKAVEAVRDQGRVEPSAGRTPRPG